MRVTTATATRTDELRYYFENENGVDGQPEQGMHQQHQQQYQQQPPHHQQQYQQPPQHQQQQRSMQHNDTIPTDWNIPEHFHDAPADSLSRTFDRVKRNMRQEESVAVRQQQAMPRSDTREYNVNNHRRPSIPGSVRAPVRVPTLSGPEEIAPSEDGFGGLNSRSVSAGRRAESSVSFRGLDQLARHPDYNFNNNASKPRSGNTSSNNFSINNNNNNSTSDTLGSPLFNNDMSNRHPLDMGSSPKEGLSSYRSIVSSATARRSQSANKAAAVDPHDLPKTVLPRAQTPPERGIIEKYPFYLQMLHMRNDPSMEEDNNSQYYYYPDKKRAAMMNKNHYYDREPLPGSPQHNQKQQQQPGPRRDYPNYYEPTAIDELEMVSVGDSTPQHTPRSAAAPPSGRRRTLFGAPPPQKPAATKKGRNVKRNQSGGGRRRSVSPQNVPQQPPLHFSHRPYMDENPGMLISDDNYTSGDRYYQQPDYASMMSRDQQIMNSALPHHRSAQPPPPLSDNYSAIPVPPPLSGRALFPSANSNHNNNNNYDNHSITTPSGEAFPLSPDANLGDSHVEKLPPILRSRGGAAAEGDAEALEDVPKPIEVGSVETTPEPSPVKEKERVRMGGSANPSPGTDLTARNRRVPAPPPIGGSSHAGESSSNRPWSEASPLANETNGDVSRWGSEAGGGGNSSRTTENSKKRRGSDGQLIRLPIVLGSGRRAPLVDACDAKSPHHYVELEAAHGDDDTPTYYMNREMDGALVAQPPRRRHDDALPLLVNGGHSVSGFGPLESQNHYRYAGGRYDAPSPPTLRRVPPVSRHPVQQRSRSEPPRNMWGVEKEKRAVSTEHLMSYIKSPQPPRRPVVKNYVVSPPRRRAAAAAASPPRRRAAPAAGGRNNNYNNVYGNKKKKAGGNNKKNAPLMPNNNIAKAKPPKLSVAELLKDEYAHILNRHGFWGEASSF